MIREFQEIVQISLLYRKKLDVKQRNQSLFQDIVFQTKKYQTILDKQFTEIKTQFLLQT